MKKFKKLITKSAKRIGAVGLAIAVTMTSAGFGGLTFTKKASAATDATDTILKSLKIKMDLQYRDIAFNTKPLLGVTNTGYTASTSSKSDYFIQTSCTLQSLSQEKLLYWTTLITNQQYNSKVSIESAETAFVEWMKSWNIDASNCNETGWNDTYCDTEIAVDLISETYKNGLFEDSTSTTLRYLYKTDGIENIAKSILNWIHNMRQTGAFFGRTGENYGSGIVFHIKPVTSSYEGNGTLTKYLSNANKHTFETVEAKAATCTENGSTGHLKCTCCNYEKGTNQVIPATGHDYHSEVTKAATCCTDGIRTYTCSHANCPKPTYTEVIPKTGQHVFNGTAKVMYDKDGHWTRTMCSTSGCTAYKDTAKMPHNMVADSADTASCTVAGTMHRHCIDCGYTDTIVTEAKGHSYDKYKYTKYETGKHKKTAVCSVCGDENGAAVIENCSYGNWKETQPQTYTLAEKQTRTCTLCGGTEEKTVGEPKTNTIQIDAKGGTGSSSFVDFVYGVSATAKVSVPVKKGYTFEGLYDGNTKVYDTNGNLAVKNTYFGSRTGVMLETKWKVKQFKVIFDANGGEGTMDAMTLAYDEDTATLTPVAFTNPTRDFIGWAKIKNATGIDLEDENIIVPYTFFDSEKDVTLYAVWKCPYTYSENTITINEYSSKLPAALLADNAYGAERLVINAEMSPEQIMEILPNFTKLKDVIIKNSVNQIMSVNNNSVYTKVNGKAEKLLYVTNLASGVAIDKNATVIGEGAFSHLIDGALNEVVVPYNIKTIEKNGLNSPIITQATFQNPDVEFEDDTCVNGSTEISAYMGSSADDFATKNNLAKRYITAIPDGAYQGSTMTDFTVSEGVETIGANAFKNCKNLQSISLGDAKVVGDNAFNGCTALEDVDLSNVTTIGKNAFNGCSSLQEITFDDNKDGKATVGTGAFLGCTNLKDIYAYDMDTEFAESAFTNAATVHTYYNSTAYKSAEKQFNPVDLMVGYENSDNTKALEEVNANVKTLKIGSSLESIGENAFVDKDLSDIDFSEATNLASIGNNAFSGTKIKILDFVSDDTEEKAGGQVVSLSAIGVNAFAGCTDLTDVIGLDKTKVNKISAGTFKDTGIRTMTLPYNILYVGPEAFTQSATPEAMTVNVENPNLQFDDTDTTENKQNIFPEGTVIKGFGKSTAYVFSVKNDDINMEANGKPSYKIEFSAEIGATNPETAGVYVLIGKKMPNIQVPTKENYTFLGYFTQADGQGVQYYQADGTSDVVWEDDATDKTTLYACWSKDKYTVIFDGNNGEGTMEDKVYDIGTEYNLPKNAFKYPTFDFMGWSTDKETVKFENEEKVSNLAKNGETLTLYAVWKLGQYTVTYNANGGEGTMTNQTMTKDINETVHACTYTKEGYTFLGWSTSSEATAPTYTDKANVCNLTTSDKTVALYAVWAKSDETLKRIDITYDGNGGVFDEEDKTTFTESIYEGYGARVSSAIPVRDGFEFIGWSSTKAGKVQYSANDDIDVSKDITLYAVWNTTGDVDYNVIVNTQKADGTYDSVKEVRKGNGIVTLEKGKDFAVNEGYIVNKAKSVLTTNLEDETVTDIVIYLDRVKAAVIYDLNATDATIAEIPSLTGLWGTTVTLNAPMPERKGYVFKGWATEKDSKEAVADVLLDKNGTTVYAIWETYVAPTEAPTQVPTVAPTEVPTQVPTTKPTETPVEVPSVEPTPTVAPTESTAEPSATQTVAPTKEPSVSEEPTKEPVATKRPNDDPILTTPSSAPVSTETPIPDSSLTPTEATKVLTEEKDAALNAITSNTTLTDKQKETLTNTILEIFDEACNNVLGADKETIKTIISEFSKTMEEYKVTYGPETTPTLTVAPSTEPTKTPDGVQTTASPYPTVDTAATDALDSVTYNNITYVMDKPGEVVLKATKNDKMTKLVIPDTVKVNGVVCKVTRIDAGAYKGMAYLKSVTIGKNVKVIGKNAFANCKKLKSITIKSKKLTTVGKSAFKNINKKAVFKVPSSKKKAYKKLLKKGGLKSKMKVK